MKRLQMHITVAPLMLALFTLCLLSAGAVAQTAQPAETPAATLRLAVIGDFGMDNQPEADVAALVASWAPDAVLTTGDNNYMLGSEETIDANVGKHYQEFIHPYLGIYGEGADYNRFFPVLGNHDWGTAAGAPPLPQPYLNYFTLPAGPGQERYYDKELGPVHIFALDSDVREPDGITSTSVQADWLRARLAASTAPWKLVLLHHPPYTSSTAHGSNATMQWPFAAWGATAVLAGHAHIYERIERDGILYFVNGLGGGPIYPIGAPIAGSQARFNADYGAMLIEATAQSITFRFIDRTGVERDQRTLTLSTSPEVQPAPHYGHIIERRVSHPADDAEESSADRSVRINSSDLELTLDADGGFTQTVGVRFGNITLPRTVHVTRAYLEFMVDEASDVPTALTIMGERGPNPAAYAETPGNLTQRRRTTTTVRWSAIPAWTVAGVRQRTPDISAIIQEQLTQPGWKEGNALAFLITGEGHRSVEAFDGVAWAAPRLHIEYTLWEREEQLFLPQVVR